MTDPVETLARALFDRCPTVDATGCSQDWDEAPLDVQDAMRAEAHALLAQIGPALVAEAVARERAKLGRRIFMQRRQLRWFHAWLMGDMASLRKTIAHRTILRKYPPMFSGPSPEQNRAAWDVIYRRIYGAAAIRARKP